MTVRFRYNTQLSPAAPFVHVRLSSPGDPSKVAENVPALIVSGADCTLVPAAIVKDMHLEQTGIRWIQGVGSRPVQEPTYAARLNFRSHSEQHLLNIVASETEPFILPGRDLLNQYRIVLDGPRQLIEIT